MSEQSQKPILRIVTVHGTFDGKDNENPEMDNSHRWYYETSEFSRILRKGLENSFHIVWENFNWSGKNQESERLRASRNLRKFLNKAQGKGDNVLILSHSHGGNVSLNHLENSPLFGNTKSITFGTPFVHVKKIRFIAFMQSIATFLLWAYICVCILTFLGVIGMFAFAAASQMDFGFVIFTVFGAAAILLPVILLGKKYWKRIESQPWMIWWRERQRSQSIKHAMRSKKYLHLIYHHEDEAVAALTNESLIEVPFLFYKKAVIIFTWILVFFALGALFYIIHKDEELSGISGRIVPLLIATPIIIAASYYLCRLPLIWAGKLLNKPVRYIVGKNLTRKLRAIGRGADTGSDIFMDSQPNIKKSNYIDLSNRRDIKKVFTDIKENADKNLVNRKSVLIERLMQSRGNLLEVISPPAGGSKYPEDKLTDALIHCNYFTGSMARYLTKYIKTLY